MGRRSWLRLVPIVLIALLVNSWIASLYAPSKSRPAIAYSPTFIDLVTQGNVADVVLQGSYDTPVIVGRVTMISRYCPCRLVTR